MKDERVWVNGLMKFQEWKTRHPKIKTALIWVLWMAAAVAWASSFSRMGISVANVILAAMLLFQLIIAAFGHEIHIGIPAKKDK